MSDKIKIYIEKYMKFIYRYVHKGTIILNLPYSKNKVKINVENNNYEIEEDYDIKNKTEGIIIVLEESFSMKKISDEINKSYDLINNKGIVAINCRAFDERDMINKENLIYAVLKKMKIQDIKTFGIYLKDENQGIDLMVIGRVHLDLLDEGKDYGGYSLNVVRSRCCGGCGKKKKNCSECPKYKDCNSKN